MTLRQQIQHREWSRVWFQQFGAGPAHTPSYENMWRAGALSWPQGDLTPVHVPDPRQYGRFQIAGKIRGEQGFPSLPLTAYYMADKESTLLKMVRLGCDHDVHIHMGICADPQDFDRGWEKKAILERASITTYGTTDLGALMPADQAAVNEEVPFSGENYYEVLRMQFAEQAATQVHQEVKDVVVCDRITCGQCGLASDGCQVVLALTNHAEGSPGLAPELVYTRDGGSNWSDTLITTLAANEAGSALACVGTNLVVVSVNSESLHHAAITDIINGVETWIEVTEGFVAGNGPRAIVSLSPRHTWMVGANGYIYFSEDVLSGVTVQSAGGVTTENLTAIHALNLDELLVVGENNAVLVTRDGGQTWGAVTGPNAGVNLTAVWMRSSDEWLVGDAAGSLWFTQDGGTTWTEKSFPGSAAGSVRDIKFATGAVGYLAHSTAAPAGRILRTTNGGATWYVAPEDPTKTIPANDYVAKLAVCEMEPNVVFGGGLASDGADGFLVKGAGSTTAL